MQRFYALDTLSPSLRSPRAQRLDDASSLYGTRRFPKVVMNTIKTAHRVEMRLHRTEEFDAAQELGRYRVIDLEALDKSGGNLKTSMRLIDTRTCEELIRHMGS